jgi:glyoxylase-like metal-dependent hydrolase (beta-lactamase superfamily II)
MTNCRGNILIRMPPFRGRELREIDFDQDIGLKAGQLKAFDFFGDGSFYLLDTPGHTVAHMAGLLRTTTNPDTFIMMGGDLCHHGGELRPSPYRPLPSELNPHPRAKMRSRRCPGGVLEDLQRNRGRTKNQAFFDVAMGADIPEAQRTIHKTQKADASDDIFFIFAHDDNVMGVIDTFPKEANNWKRKGWGDQARWGFLKDFGPAVCNDSRLK